MLKIRGDGFSVPLFDLETAPESGMRVGRCGREVFAWDAAGRFVQAFAIPGRSPKAALAEVDGRPTIVAAEDLDEGERGPVRVRAIDAATGLVRWRRTEKTAEDLEVGLGHTSTVVRVVAGRGGPVLDLSTGGWSRTSWAMTTPARYTEHAKVPPDLVAPPRDVVWGQALRSPPLPGRPKEDAAERARRKALFGSTRVPGPFEPTPTPWITRLVAELDRVIGAPPTPIPSLEPSAELPGDVVHVLAARVLDWSWGATPELQARHADDAWSAGAPSSLVAIGREVRPRLPHRARWLCVQATSMGARAATYDGQVYEGPVPLATVLSEALWDLVEARTSAGSAPQDPLVVATAARMRALLAG